MYNNPMMTAKYLTIWGLAALALTPIAHAADSSTPFVTVGGETISQSDYLQALEAQAGKAVLQKLVFGSLIRQAAAKAGVTPTDAEVDKRMATLMRRNPSFVPDAQKAPEQHKQFVENLKLDIALENLRMRNISVTDAEVNQYFTAHSADYKLPPQVQTTVVVTDSAADSRTAETLLRSGVSETAIGEKPGFHVAGIDGYAINMDSLSTADKTRISNLVFNAKPKQVQTLIVQKHYLTFLIKNKDVNRIPALSEVRTEVVRAAKLAKAPSAADEIRKLYLWTPPAFQDQKYEREFDDVNPGVSH